jgi:hypothetical protein
MPSAGIEPAAPTSEWAQSYDLDRAAPGISYLRVARLTLAQGHLCVGKLFYLTTVASYFLPAGLTNETSSVSDVFVRCGACLRAENNRKRV